jgi:hypothetical protein
VVDRAIKTHEKKVEVKKWNAHKMEVLTRREERETIMGNEIA